MTVHMLERPRKMSPGHMVALFAGVFAGALGSALIVYSATPLVAIAPLAAGVALILIGAAGLGRSIASADESPRGTSAIRLQGSLDPALSRWKWIVKWALAIPHFAVLTVLWIAFMVVTVAAGLVILFTGRYPAPLFEFATGVLRWNWRVAFYSNGVLGSDAYPPFTLARTSYPATFEVSRPRALSRWKVLIKSWLLALPHLLIVTLVTGGTWAAWTGGAGESISLLGVLLLVAAIILLITGRYEQRLFDVLMGAHRWMYRVLAYTALMRDEYPPFRLDEGSSEK